MLEWMNAWMTDKKCMQFTEWMYEWMKEWKF